MEMAHAIIQSLLALKELLAEDSSVRAMWKRDPALMMKVAIETLEARHVKKACAAAETARASLTVYGKPGIGHIRQEKDNAMNAPESNVAEVPKFVLVSVSCSNAFGPGGDYDLLETICGLDGDGCVWRWVEADPERPGSQSGWERLGPRAYVEGSDPAPRKVQTR